MKDLVFLLLDEYDVRLTHRSSSPHPGVKALAGWAFHTCALLSGGSVDCWGANIYGQLGTGDTANRLTPTGVMGLETGETVVIKRNISEIVCISVHVCACGACACMYLYISVYVYIACIKESNVSTLCAAMDVVWRRDIVGQIHPTIGTCTGSGRSRQNLGCLNPLGVQKRRHQALVHP